MVDLIYRLECNYCGRDRIFAHLSIAAEQENEICWHCEKGWMIWTDKPVLPDKGTIEEFKHHLRKMFKGREDNV